MLLYCVAKEGSTGTSNDPGIPGIHIEGVRESCMGPEKRKRVSLQGARHCLGVCLPPGCSSASERPGCEEGGYPSL